MRDEMPQEIQSLIAQCEVGVSSFDNDQMSAALHWGETLFGWLKKAPLWRAMRRGVYVPRKVARCPECGGELQARSLSWEDATGRPIATSIEVDCDDDLAGGTFHSFTQDKWQPVRDAVAKWCDARVDYPNR